MGKEIKTGWPLSLEFTGIYWDFFHTGIYNGMQLFFNSILEFTGKYLF